MWNFGNPHLKDQIETLTVDDWEDIQRIALSIIHEHPNMQLMTAEANAMIAMITEKEKGRISLLLN